MPRAVLIPMTLCKWPLGVPVTRGLRPAFRVLVCDGRGGESETAHAATPQRIDVRYQIICFVVLGLDISEWKYRARVAVLIVH